MSFVEECILNTLIHIRKLLSTLVRLHRHCQQLPHFLTHISIPHPSPTHHHLFWPLLCVPLPFHFTAPLSRHSPYPPPPSPRPFFICGDPSPPHLIPSPSQWTIHAPLLLDSPKVPPFFFLSRRLGTRFINNKTRRWYYVQHFGS